MKAIKCWEYMASFRMWIVIGILFFKLQIEGWLNIQLLNGLIIVLRPAMCLVGFEPMTSIYSLVICGSYQISDKALAHFTTMTKWLYACLIDFVGAWVSEELCWTSSSLTARCCPGREDCIQGSPGVHARCWHHFRSQCQTGKLLFLWIMQDWLNKLQASVW